MRDRSTGCSMEHEVEGRDSSARDYWRPQRVVPHARSRAGSASPPAPCAAPQERDDRALACRPSGYFGDLRPRPGLVGGREGEAGRVVGVEAAGGMGGVLENFRARRGVTCGTSGGSISGQDEGSCRGASASTRRRRCRAETKSPRRRPAGGPLQGDPSLKVREARRHAVWRGRVCWCRPPRGTRRTRPSAPRRRRRSRPRNVEAFGVSFKW